MATDAKLSESSMAAFTEAFTGLAAPMPWLAT